MDAPTRPLSTLESGARARLRAIDGERSFRRRLMELGLLPGTPVRVVRRSDRRGLIELEVRRSRLSLRLAEAAAVRVEEPERSAATPASTCCVPPGPTAPAGTGGGA